MKERQKEKRKKKKTTFAIELLKKEEPVNEKKKWNFKQNVSWKENRFENEKKLWRCSREEKNFNKNKTNCDYDRRNKIDQNLDEQQQQQQQSKQQ